MIKCPNPDCGYENVDGTQFCEVCGEELPQPKAAAVDASDLIPCPQCGELNPKDNVACEACGAELHPHATPAPIAPDAATAVPPAVVAAVVEDEATPFDALTEAASAPAPTAPAVPTAPAGGGLQAGKVKLVVEQGQTVGAQFVLGDPEMLVGREDEEEDIYPDIDLSDQDAGYVHRKHATLRFENGGLTVTHLGGANKTRINNKPVPDNVPTPVNLGDKLAFGKVVLRLLPV
jgi:hypothetical protein